ncbi:Tc toxin subunit A-related protein [Streptosporangium canum]|uniref:Tc toxin subunit A-related protein n=1 Tax=Streptosporangium canum TaxID=324952 RepID=UPI003791B58F
MVSQESSPDYTSLFGELRFPERDDARSVWSPAAYFVELLGLLEGTFGRPELLDRRPDLTRIVLDKENTFTETAYLDIVNEVLERLVGDQPYETLRKAAHPFGLPFSLKSERLRVCLEQLKATPEELYRLFAAQVDHDVAAREYLGLTPEDVAVITGSDVQAAALGQRYGLAAGETLAALRDTRRFAEATGLTDAELRELVAMAGQAVPEGRVTLNTGETSLVPPSGADLPPAWLDRAHRLVRLARKTGLTLTHLDLVLTSCAQGRLDPPALRAVAAVVRLGKVHGQTIPEVCGLIVPWKPDPKVTVETCSGDILTPANRDYRFRLARLIGVAEPDIVRLVLRYRERYADREPSPFDRGQVGLAEISLLRRAGLLAAALGVGPDELCDVLVALEGDPSVQRYSTFAVLGGPAPETRDFHKVLEGGAPEQALWLAQTLFAVITWMRAAGFDGAELAGILGGRPDPATGDPHGLAALFARLRDALDPVALGPDALRSDRFGPRAARVIHDVLAAFPDGVVAAVGSGLLEVHREKAEKAAYEAVTDLGVVFPSDLTGLGLGDRLQAKIFRNLVLRGVLGADGGLAAPPEREPDLAGDFTGHRDALFEIIADEVDGPAELHPSHLERLPGLSPQERRELYDNLVYRRHLGEDGTVLDPDFFRDPDNAGDLSVNVPLADAAAPVAELLRERLAEFRTSPLTLDSSVLAGLRLTDAQFGRLVDSLRFNGHLDAERRYTDKEALLRAAPADFGLAAEFAALRPAVLAALRGQVAEFHAGLTTFTAEDFADLADDLAAHRVHRALDDAWLDEGQIADPGEFAEPGGAVDLGSGFTGADESAVFDAMAAIAAQEAPYRVSRSAFTALGLTDLHADRLLDRLVTAGHLTERHAVARDRLAYFANADNSLDFTLPDMVDFAREVFFVLHDTATALTAAVTEATDRVAELAGKQDQALHACLSDVLGLDAAATRAVVECVAGSAQEARALFARPALDTDGTPTDPRVVLAHRRIRRFALLAAKLGLRAAEIRAVFADQDLTGKYPEPLTLPPGVARIQALLDAGDGVILLFGDDGGYWTYSAATRARTSPARRPLTDLSPRLSALAAVDAAFVRPDGTSWLVGRDAKGAALAFTREKGGTRWAPRAQRWGKVKNAFADPVRIDGAFTDNDGRVYLFAGDQYVRYSAGYDTVDEGYPRDVAEWRSREGLPAPRVREAVDACFQDLDGVVHVFAGDRWITTAGERPAAEVWGRVETRFADLKSVDAAYTTASAVHVLSGGEMLRYSDSIENAGVLADEGVPRRLRDLPPQFEGGVEAAFTDPSGVLHLFKAGRTVALDGARATTAVTAERWGALSPALTAGRVDAGFAGLDGRTYLFSGDTYLRYSTADYTTVDSGFPRRIADDWGGLTRVDASFVMDGRTYLFGTGGLVREIPADHQPDLDAGRLTPALRALFAEHGLTVTALRGSAPRWELTTGEGVALTVVREGLRLKARGDGAAFYVRYSARDYRTPDPGFPKPLADNWWNMPEGMRLGPVDAVFTGRDERTYLFSGDRFVWFDARHRWWSEPMALRERWDSLPFARVDAAFVGADGRTYVFSGDRHVRYSTADRTQVDDGYPAQNAGRWGRVAHTLARTGRVDAAFVLDVPEQVDGVEVVRTRTYLFSGDQYVRYTGAALTVVDPGYPRRIAELSGEPGLAALPVTLDGVDAAFADRRTAYLFRGGECHAVSTAGHRRYTDLPVGGVRCAYVEDGSLVVDTADGWRRLSALEGRTVAAAPFRPRALRTVPARFTSGLDAVLTGADGVTYLFRGPSCFNTQVGRDYPIAEEWGRPRDLLRETGEVDAAFVARDGRIHLFSGDQYVTHAPGAALAEGDPKPIADRWAGLEGVALAYVHRGKTHLYGKPDAAGRVRHVVYSDESCAAPDPGYPVTIEAAAAFPGSPLPFPDAVLVEDTALVLLAGKRCATYSDRTGAWSAVRPIERLYPGFGAGLDAPDSLRSALRTADGAVWFFFADTCAPFQNEAFGPRVKVRDQWGRSPNPFLAPGATVDAAFVWRGDRTYLFSGDRYVRYTGRVYRHVDPGYPKPIAGNLRREEPFARLPETFEDALDRPLDAVVGNDRTVHVLVGGVCHTASSELAATFGTGRLGALRNNLAATGKVDAALVADRRIYLFSGDQYVRYSGADRTFVDDGYPRALADLPGDLSLAALPSAFQDGVDAAFRGADGVVRLFRGREFFAAGTAGPVAGRWGKVCNSFDTGPLDAAFTAPSGELYAFSGGQYVRYPATGTLDHPEAGYPRTVRDDWGDAPQDFEDGPDGAFTLDGRTYLLKGDRYLRYSDPYHQVDRTFPQQFRHRWSGTADHRLSDLHTIVRFAALCRGRDGLAAFFLDGAEDPYAYLASAFGWPLEEVRWARRNMGLLRPGTSEEHLFEIEFLLTLADAFGASAKTGIGVPELYGVWAKMFGPAPDLDGAAAAVRAAIERRASPQEWPKISAAMRDRLNVRKRDALVARLTPLHGNARDLYERYLIDVEMGGQGTTSRVREAIAATQLYLQRYLLGLEKVTLPAGVDPEAVRARLRTWWGWMRSYRTWEANRKVFLYPENYLRPELRDRKTPAFSALQDDLLQGDITEKAVQASYKRYLDEYTEVSRLTIAGGYVYRPEGTAAEVRRLVLFGRTRTDPRRYYHRTAEFRDGGRLSAAWDAWEKVDVQIAADRVDPVHAFGRIFVFWSTVEPVPPADPSKVTVTAKSSGSDQKVSGPPPRYQVKICYSFRNLDGAWVAPQVLASDAEREGQITDVSLYVQASRKVPGVSEHDSIIVQCSYTVGSTAHSAAFTLTPELYALPAATVTPPPRAADLSALFAEPAETPITPDRVVRFNAPADSEDGPWFSVDHKGGSFLCRPVAAPADPAPVQPFKGNADRLPTTWDRVDAAVRLPDGTLYFFESATGIHVAVPPDKVTSRQTRQPTGDRFGAVSTRILRTGAVDAGFFRTHTYLFSGDEYYRYPVISGPSVLGPLETGYPKKLAGNTERLPQWQAIDAAVTLPGGTELFYAKAVGFVTGDDLANARSAAAEWRVPAGAAVDRFHVADGKAYAVFGDRYVKLRSDLAAEHPPKALAGNTDGVPEQRPPGPVVHAGRATLAFDNANAVFKQSGGGSSEGLRDTRGLGRATTEFGRTGEVTAAYLADGKLYLVGPREFVRFTLAADGTVPDFADDGYPKPTARQIRGVLSRGDQRFAFGPAGYAPIPKGWEPSTPLTFLPYRGNWRGLPAGFPGDFTGLLEGDTHLYLFLGQGYAAHPYADAVPRPFEVASLPTQLIRLTSSTAAELNRRLLTGGVPALLDPATQELDELPAFSTTASNASTIRIKPRIAPHAPVSSHLDFDSANGPYYWEIFFHAPLLIAQTLNGGQRFEDARRWYEYVFDPTRIARYWRFLPFLAADVDALVARTRQDLAELASPGMETRLNPVLTALSALTPAFRRARDLTGAELAYLADLGGTGLDQVRAALAALTPDARTAALGERIEMIARLRRQYDLMGDRRALIQAYLDDPFDPHTIAALRPEAYRRAVVMAYIDNLLDWGDMLFRQYTAETVDEARMLYVYAYDLLGPRPVTLGPAALPPAAPYALTEGDGPGETGHLTADGTLLKDSGAVHAGIANPYFCVPGNELFQEYWTRVEDRLTKIRASLDILGVARPLPLFDPPLDVMALVRGAAEGGGLDAAMAAAAVPVPVHRFDFVLQRARELTDRLRQLGTDLLEAVDRRDSEELALLQQRQQGEIIGLTRKIRELQVKIAEEGVAEARDARTAAEARVAHYQKLINDGMSPLQQAQIAMMSLGAIGQFVSAGLKIGSGIAAAVPQAKLGPFIVGAETGGLQLSKALEAAGEVSASFGEGFSMIGEVLGLRAEFDSQVEDWRFQLDTSRSDVVQVGHQITTADLQLAIARRELEIHDREAAQHAAVTDFLTAKFAGPQLYGWMVGQVSGLYFQTYKLAHDMARAAERSYESERGASPGLIRAAYWDSRRKGLLAADQLALDLDRLGQAYYETDARGMEITKRVSLLGLDAPALLALRDTGRCEFALTETLFDRDFPGHYQRRIKSVSVAFLTAEGPVPVNATLTQIDNKTVLAADPKAVRFLLDPKGPPPESVRGDWLPGQRIALSEVQDGEDSGVFDLRYDDQRLLPFEGTGAVSRWRLEARRVPAGLVDVAVTVRYTARDGGETFATAVRGMLKPYPAAILLDVESRFPEEWEAFLGDGGELLLPITQNLFPGISGRQVTGIVAQYAAPDTEARFLLHGDPALALAAGRLVQTPGLNADNRPWRLTASGDPAGLAGFSLILLYRALP